MDVKRKEKTDGGAKPLVISLTPRPIDTIPSSGRCRSGRVPLDVACKPGLVPTKPSRRTNAASTECRADATELAIGRIHGIRITFLPIHGDHAEPIDRSSASTASGTATIANRNGAQFTRKHTDRAFAVRYKLSEYICNGNTHVYSELSASGEPSSFHSEYGESGITSRRSTFQWTSFTALWQSTASFCVPAESATSAEPTAFFVSSHLHVSKWPASAAAICPTASAAISATANAATVLRLPATSTASTNATSSPHVAFRTVGDSSAKRCHVRCVSTVHATSTESITFGKLSGRIIDSCAGETGVYWIQLLSDEPRRRSTAQV
jgi:hypothetical protein